MENLTIFGIFISIFAVIISVSYRYFFNKRKLFYESKHTLNTEQKISSWPTDGNMPMKELIELSKNEDNVNDNNENSDLDPVDFCSHIQREIKKTQHKAALKKIESTMTNEQKEEERAIQRKQLEDIFNLMVQQQEFGVKTVDDIQEQMKLYA